MLLVSLVQIENQRTRQGWLKLTCEVDAGGFR